MRIAAFDWDQGNWPKCGKHGVTQQEVEAVLSAGRPGIYRDRTHSRVEDRFLAIGRTPAGRYVLVAFTLRRRGGETLVRPISARFMHAKEIRDYEHRHTKEDPAPGQ